MPHIAMGHAIITQLHCKSYKFAESKKKNRHYERNLLRVVIRLVIFVFFLIGGLPQLCFAKFRNDEKINNRSNDGVAFVFVENFGIKLD